MTTTERQSLPRVVSWAISLAVHFLLLALFLIVNFRAAQEVPEYSEMDFVSVPTVARAATDRPPPVSPPASEAQPPAKADEAPENLALPKMRHLPEEEPRLTERRVEKIAPTEKPFGGQVQSAERDETYPVAQTAGREEKPVPRPEKLTVGESPHVGTGGDEARARPYSIEGAASARQVITEVLPEYPPGLNREAVIRIRFTVLPNGTVGEMVPLLKGDTTLEDITLRAFRRWRFNPLPPDAPQVSQSGVITFRYILK